MDPNILLAPSPNWYGAQLCDVCPTHQLCAYAAASSVVVVCCRTHTILRVLPLLGPRCTALSFARDSTQPHQEQHHAESASDSGQPAARNAPSSTTASARAADVVAPGPPTATLDVDETSAALTCQETTITARNVVAGLVEAPGAVDASLSAAGGHSASLSVGCAAGGVGHAATAPAPGAAAASLDSGAAAAAAAAADATIRANSADSRASSHSVLLVVGCSDGSLRSFSLGAGAEGGQLKMFRKKKPLPEISAAAVLGRNPSHATAMAVVGDVDGRLLRWPMGAGGEPSVLGRALPGGRVMSLAVTHCSQRLVVARATGGISIVDAASGVQLASVLAHRGPIHTLQLFSTLELGLDLSSMTPAPAAQTIDARCAAAAMTGSAASSEASGAVSSTGAVERGDGAGPRQYVLSSGEDCCVRVWGLDDLADGSSKPRVLVRLPQPNAGGGAQASPGGRHGGGGAQQGRAPAPWVAARLVPGSGTRGSPHAGMSPVSGPRNEPAPTCWIVACAPGNVTLAYAAALDTGLTSLPVKLPQLHSRAVFTVSMMLQPASVPQQPSLHAAAALPDAASQCGSANAAAAAAAAAAATATRSTKVLTGPPSRSGVGSQQPAALCATDPDGCAPVAPGTTGGAATTSAPAAAPAPAPPLPPASAGTTGGLIISGSER
ncbi:MAG: hypothetical protein WDW38_004532 [Sanguina aurantia]